MTGIAIPEMLRASHTKPWSECESDEERLDVFNGFLLSANLDALFDRGLISFDAEGRLLVSNQIPAQQRYLVSLDDSLVLRWVAAKHLVYLKWHRQFVFQI